MSLGVTVSPWPESTRVAVALARARDEMVAE
jgi:hypothetical protein